MRVIASHGELWRTATVMSVMRAIVFGCLLSSACTSALEPLEATPPTEPTAPAAALDTVPELAAEPDPTPEPEPEPVWWALTPADILMQLDHQPTFAAVDVRNPFEPYGRVPEITVYRDGTILYRGSFPHESGFFVTRYGSTVVQHHLDHVLELGFEAIESYENDCKPTPKGEVCMSDAGLVVLRVRVGDELREVRNYGGWALHHEAVLHAIYDRLELLETPAPGSPWGLDPRPYVPQRATLFLRAEKSVDELSPSQRESIEPWALSDALFEQGYVLDSIAVAVEGDELEQLATVMGNGVGKRAWFRHGERIVKAELVPWLPGVDHREQLATRGP